MWSSPEVKTTVSAVGAAGLAMASAAVIGVAPTLTVSPQLMATLHYLRGTNIGAEPTEQQFEGFIGAVLNGTATTPPDAPYEKVPYNAGFWPFSKGGFGDLTYNASVGQGVELLEAQQPAAGDVIFGFSQGAVAAAMYKGDHTGNTYFLVGNPSRPNGGVMERFHGWRIPFVDVTFSGATPNNGDLTFDIARQYDGWADFPTYLWNPVAVANAVMGILLVHGDTQFELSAADLEQAREAGNDYYQFDHDSNTAYYVIKTYPVPLLMPLQTFLPDSIIAALDEPLRWFIETAYDRSDYSKPTSAALLRPWGRVGASESPDAGMAIGEPSSAMVTSDDETALLEDESEALEQRAVEGQDLSTHDDPQAITGGDVLEGDALDGDVLEGDALDGDALEGDVLESVEGPDQETVTEPDSTPSQPGTMADEDEPTATTEKTKVTEKTQKRSTSPDGADAAA